VRQDGEYGYQIDSSKYIEDATWSILNNPRVKLIGTYLDGHTCKVKVEPGAVKNFTIRYGTNDDYIEQEIKIDVAPYLISGPQTVYPYETYTYTSSIGGVFTINNTKIAKIEKQDENSCTVKILTGKKNNFILSLELTEQDEELWGLLELPIEIKSY
jgi:hypothetical protein